MSLNILFAAFVFVLVGGAIYWDMRKNVRKFDE